MAALSPSLVWARARWQWDRWRRRPGMAGAALGLSLLLLVLAGLGWLQARDQWQRQQAQAAAGTGAGTATSTGQRPARPERRAALGEFYAALPAQDDIPALVQSLLDGAAQQGLRAERGSYRIEPEPAAPMARFWVALPLRGEPARVQRFVLSALQAHPTLALDALQFKRDPDGLALIEARVQFVMHLQAGLAGPARAAVAAPPADDVVMPAGGAASKGVAP